MKAISNKLDMANKINNKHTYTKWEEGVAKHEVGKRTNIRWYILLIHRRMR